MSGRKRKRGQGSEALDMERRTRRVEGFLKHIDAKSIAPYANVGAEKEATDVSSDERNLLKEYLHRCLDQKHPDDAAKSSTDYNYPGTMLHSFLLDAGLDQYEPLDRVFIGTSQIRTALCGQNNLNRLKKEPNINPSSCATFALINSPSIIKPLSRLF